jgi:hypothetical protein
MAREHERTTAGIDPGTREAMSGFANLPGGIIGMMYQVWLAGIGIAVKAASETPRIIGSLAEEGARVQRAMLDVAGKAAHAARGDVADLKEGATRRTADEPGRRQTSRAKSRTKTATRGKGNGTRGRRAAGKRSTSRS